MPWPERFPVIPPPAHTSSQCLPWFVCRCKASDSRRGAPPFAASDPRGIDRLRAGGVPRPGALALFAIRFAPEVHHIAFVRTLIVCAFALTISFVGSRSRRIELTWIAYATLAFVAVKLVFEDLRHGHLEYIAGSLFLFAITLLSVPRLARRTTQTLDPHSDTLSKT